MKRRWIPPILCDIVQTSLSACDGLVFDHYRCCPVCGGPAAGYDRKKKQFAVLCDGERNTTIRITVKRFRCVTCGKIFSAEAPIYPKTRIGSPIVDLCVTSGLTMPFSRVSTHLAFLGIIVDRWSVRKYILDHGHRMVAATELYGINVPLSLVNLTGLIANSSDTRPLDPQDVLTACGFQRPPEGSINDETQGNNFLE
jgi:rubredoxin